MVFELRVISQLTCTVYGSDSDVTSSFLWVLLTIRPYTLICDSKCNLNYCIMLLKESVDTKIITSIWFHYIKEKR